MIMARGRRSDRDKVRKSFLWSVGQSVGRSIGGGLDGEGQSGTADGRKFLLLFRTALFPKRKKSILNYFWAHQYFKTLVQTVLIFTFLTAIDYARVVCVGCLGILTPSKQHLCNITMHAFLNRIEWYCTKYG